MIKTFFLLLFPLLLSATYLPSARRCALPDHNLENREIYCSFDFLFWEGIENGLEFALKNNRATFDQNIQIYEPDFSFEPAFRIGIGTHLPYDQWDLEFYYTRYYTHTINHAHHRFANPLGPQNSGIFSVWSNTGNSPASQFRAVWSDVEAKWKIHANLFDLLLKHRLCISPAITIEPAFGLKMALLQQRFSVLYENGNFISLGRGPNLEFISSKIAMKNRSFNLGPTASMNTKWNFATHFDLLGSFSGALLASRFEVGRNEFDISGIGPLPLFTSIREGDEYWTLRPQTALTLGLGWSDCVCSKQSVLHYGFSASYEAQVWWKQNMLYRFIDQTNAAMISPTQGNLFFHGLTIEGFADF